MFSFFLNILWIGCQKKCRLNNAIVVIDSPSIVCLRHSFELNASEQSPINEGVGQENKMIKGNTECI